MPKMKTNKSAAKRFKSTASGKFKRARAFKSHLMSNKTAKQKRKISKTALVDTTFENQVKKLLPYG